MVKSVVKLDGKTQRSKPTVKPSGQKRRSNSVVKPDGQTQRSNPTVKLSGQSPGARSAAAAAAARRRTHRQAIAHASGWVSQLSHGMFGFHNPTMAWFGFTTQPRHRLYGGG
jgi:hypothetical protein